MTRVRRVDPAKPATAALLQWLQLEVLPHDAPLATDDGVWWVAYVDDAPAGFASVKTSPRYVGLGYLSRAGVLPAYRGHGLQKRLIRVREAYARRQGWTALITDTTAANPASANSLIACGFRMYQPQQPWALPNSCYWRKPLQQAPQNG